MATVVGRDRCLGVGADVLHSFRRVHPAYISVRASMASWLIDRSHAWQAGPAVRL